MKPKAIKNALYTIFMAALTILVLILLLGRIQNRVTFIFNRAVIWILSPSMEDEIPEQSYILIKKADTKQIEIDDVIVFYSDDPTLAGALNTHRVFDIIGENEEFVTKGDNMMVVDSYTAKSHKVVGVYVRRLTILTVVMNFFRTGWGITLIIISLLSILGMSVLQIFKPKQKNSKNIENKTQVNIIKDGEEKN